MSISKNELRQVRSLAQKKFRDESGLFVVEGEKMVSEALASGFEVVSVYRRDEICEEAMARLSMLSSPSPVLAVVRQPAPAPFHPSKGLFLALDGIRDPGNLGTILRVADWFGIDGVVASPDTVELYNPKVVQATMGAIFRVPFSGWTSQHSAGRSWPAADMCTGRSWMARIFIPRRWTAARRLLR